MNEGVNHLPHVGGKRVEGGLLGPRALEMTVLVTLGTEQPLLSQSDVQKGRDETELGDEGPLQLLIVHHQQVAPKLQPAQRMGRPPGGVAGDKLWPFCTGKSTI